MERFCELSAGDPKTRRREPRAFCCALTIHRHLVIPSDMTQISSLRADARKFAENGGNETLFWAGRMSELVGQMLNSDLRNVSSTAELLGQVKREYDDLIIAATKEKGAGEVALSKEPAPRFSVGRLLARSHAISKGAGGKGRAKGFGSPFS